MGYRERKQVRAQQAQQALGKSVQSEQQVLLPAPKTMNLRDNPLEMPQDHALLLENAFVTDGGVKLFRSPKNNGPYLVSTSSPAQVAGPFMSYYGSGSTSAEFWVVDNARAHRLTESFTFWGAQTASVDNSNMSVFGDWTEFKKTIIYVGNGVVRQKWNRASAWATWQASVSVSGVSAGAFTGITHFKNRLYGWKKKSTIVFYGSVDQIIPTFHPFDLGAVLTGSIRQVISLPRDGGAGPDDYIGFVSDQGDVAMYAGSNPGDANDWSLVGTYKIGRPLSRDSHIQHGNQTIVLCEDDFYFLPEDLTGKKQKSLGATYRQPESQDGLCNAVYDSEQGKIIFGEGSVLDPHRGYAFSTLKLNSADPALMRRWSKQIWKSNSYNNSRHVLGEHKGRTFVLAGQNPYVINTSGASPTGLNQPHSLFWSYGSGSDTGIFPPKVRTAPIRTSGRTNISLVNVLIGAVPRFSAPVADFVSASGVMATAPSPPYDDPTLDAKYALGVEYDQYNRALTSVSADLITASTGTARNTYGDWMPAMGTGHYAQLYFELINATSDVSVVLYGFNTTISDTGGL